MRSKLILIAVLIIAVVVSGAAIFLFKNQSAKKAIMPSVDLSEELFVQAGALLEKNEYLPARDKLQKIINEFPNSKNISEVKNKLESLNLKLILSAIIIPGKTKIYVVQRSDALEQIAKKFDTTVELIKKSNNLKSDLIHPDQKLRIWTAKFSCVTDKSQNILILKSDEEVVKTYNVSTGVNNSTPVGTFKVINKLINPVWYNAGAIVLPESPDNILGSRWLGFEISGYGIHGTTQPETIGQQITQGCIRMRNNEVEELYDLLPVGIEVTIVD